jgi:hypothetical protein
VEEPEQTLEDPAVTVSVGCALTVAVTATREAEVQPVVVFLT